MPSSPPDDARRIFSGIGATYEKAGALLSFGQDARWRARLVESVQAAADDVVLDVATGTGLVARALSVRYRCDVVGLDRSADMLGAASARDGHIPLVRARAESLPFPDESFDHVTFTYLLRYVDDPAAVMRELARVVRPGGRIDALDFGVPRNPLLRGIWRGYTAGRLWVPSYVLVGAALAPMPGPRVVAGGLLAFFLAVGVASHSFDELQGRPLGTQIPSGGLVALGTLALGGAVALGAVAAAQIGLWFLVLVALGAALVISYGLQLPIVHSAVGFALAWGGFPVVASAAANGAPLVATIAAAVGASLVSLAQRRLSTPVRRIRRKAADVRGSVRYRDGTVEPIDAARLIRAPESALRLLWLALAAISIGTLLARWAGG